MAHPPLAHMPVLQSETLQPPHSLKCPSSKEHFLIVRTDDGPPPDLAQVHGRSSQAEASWLHLPSTTAMRSWQRCSWARSAGLCMDSSTPSRIEPSRFTNCRTDSRGHLEPAAPQWAWLEHGGPAPVVSQNPRAWPQGSSPPMTSPQGTNPALPRNSGDGGDMLSALSYVVALWVLRT